MSPIKIDTSNTHVLLIGANEFFDEPSLNPIPNIRQNIQLLHKVFLDDNLADIPNENVSISLNATKKQINRKITNLVKHTNKSSSTLIIYFSGYAYTCQETKQLILVASDTNLNYLSDEGISLHDLHQKLKRSEAGKKIIILDLCFQQKNAESYQQVSAFSELEYVDDIFVYATSSDSESTMYPVGQPDEPTFFTRHFINTLYQGIDNESPYITTGAHFSAIEKAYEEEKLVKIPRKYGNAKVQDIILSRNPNYNQEIEKSDQEEDHFWLDAQDQNSALAYDDYLERYPNGRYFSLAIQNLKKIEEEEAAWRLARRKNLLFSYREYLYNYPEGKYSQEAYGRIKKLKLAAKKADVLSYSNQAIGNQKHEDVIKKHHKAQKSNPNGKKTKNSLIDAFISNESSITPSTQLNTSKEDLSAPAINESDELITESLTRLLVKQKQYKKAIEYYNRLKTKQPEKKSEFDAEIERVKELM